VVFYGYENWCLTLREEHKLGLFENTVLSDEVTGDWRKLLNELINFYTLLSIIKIIKSRLMRWAGQCSTNGEECIQDFGVKAKRKQATTKTTK
jgi:hypothetical protein